MSWREVDLPDGWSVSPLLDVADVVMGQSPPGRTYNTEGDGLPFFQGKAEFGSDFPTARKWCTAPTRVAEPGDILMSVRAPVGPTNIADQRCAVGRGLAVIKARPGVPPSLVRHAIKLQEDEIASWGTGSTFTAISKRHFRDIEVVLPPEPGREPLADLLDATVRLRRSSTSHLMTARRSIERFRTAVLAAACSGRLTADWRGNDSRSRNGAEELLAELRSRSGNKHKQRSLPESLLHLPESWRVASGAEAFVFVTSGSRGWAKHYSDQGPAFLRVGNLDRHRLDLDLAVVQAVTPPSSAESKRTRVQPGDLLISITAEVGMVGVAPLDLGEAYVNQHVAIARPHPKLTSRYLAAFVAAPSYGEAQLDALQRGATKAGLGLDDIRALSIPLPPPAEQVEIARRLDRLMAFADGLEARLDAADQRINRSSQAVLAKAFRGELTPASGAPA